MPDFRQNAHLHTTLICVVSSYLTASECALTLHKLIVIVMCLKTVSEVAGGNNAINRPLVGQNKKLVDVQKIGHQLAFC